jgi:hypothetical protein
MVNAGLARLRKTESIMQELRTTTGQRVVISYDPTRNALTFSETDWFAEPIRSTGVPVKSHSVRPLVPPNVVAMPTRRLNKRRAA